MRRIMALREQGCTLVFCSHDLHVVGEVCDRVLWLREGRPAMLAGAEPVLKAYQDHVRERDGASAEPERQAQPVRPKENCIRAVTLGGDCQDGVIETGRRLEVRVSVQLSANTAPETVHLGILLIRNDAVWCYGVSTKMDGLSSPLVLTGGNEYGVAWIVDDLPLLSGQYSFTVGLMDNQSPHLYDTWTGAAPFVVRHPGKEVGVMRMTHRWEAPTLQARP
jgi:lipopolysaccharide transport system ATP-binding protein